MEHAREVTATGEDGRAFRPTGELTFSRRTCFVLTAAGILAAQSWCQPLGIEARVAPNGGERLQHADGHRSGQWYGLGNVPQWDANARKLRFDGQLVETVQVGPQ